MGDTRPDYGREEVRQYLRDNALMWLHDYRMGLRFDYIRNVKGNDNPGDDLPEGWNLLRWINDEINARRGRSRSPRTCATTRRSRRRRRTAIRSGTQGLCIRSRALIVADDVHNMLSVAGAISNRYNNDAFRRVIYTESHDEVANGKARVPEEVWPQNADSLFAKKRSTLGRHRFHLAGNSHDLPGGVLGGRLV